MKITGSSLLSEIRRNVFREKKKAIFFILNCRSLSPV